MHRMQIFNADFLSTNGELGNWGMLLYACLAVKTIPKFQTLGCLGF